MNTNPNQILEHFATAQSPLGRLKLRLSFQLRRSAWVLRNFAGAAVKRAFDIVVSALLLIALAPLFLIVGILVKLDGGPIFFSQIRVGRYGRQFKMYKVRSMCMNAEEKLKELLAKNAHKEGVTFKLKDDPRITKVGKWIRKLSIDELPQLFNVLKGDMSLVGPRPPVPREVALYTLTQRQRLAVKPGLTCIWQVSGRSQIDFSGQVKLDVSYIETQSFWVDVKILARTVPAVLTARGAC